MDDPRLDISLAELEAMYTLCMLGNETPSCAYVGEGIPGIAPGVYFRRPDGVVEYMTFEEYEGEERENE